jgi:hypothetical protein
MARSGGEQAAEPVMPLSPLKTSGSALSLASADLYSHCKRMTCAVNMPDVYTFTIVPDGVHIPMILYAYIVYSINVST